MIILVGASASGKTEVAKILSQNYAIKKVVTHTTRLKREHEIDGIDYHFLTIEQFIDLKNQDFFVETTFYNNNYYGTSHKELSGDKVLIVDPNGLQVFRNLNNPSIVSFLLVANSSTRFERMLERGDSRGDALKRIENDEKKFNLDIIGHVDYVIDSEQLKLDDMTKKIYQTYLSVIKNKTANCKN